MTADVSNLLVAVVQSGSSRSQLSRTQTHSSDWDVKLAGNSSQQWANVDTQDLKFASAYVNLLGL